MCKVNSGAMIKTQQDVQNLVIGILFRQQHVYRIENIIDLVQYYMDGSSITITKDQLHHIILENLDLLYIKNKVKCKNGYYTPQPLKCVRC